MQPSKNLFGFPPCVSGIYSLDNRQGGVAMSIYTVKEVAILLRVSSKTIYKMIHTTELECVKVRGQIRITSEALNRLLKGDLNNAER